MSYYESDDLRRAEEARERDEGLAYEEHHERIAGRDEAREEPTDEEGEPE